VIGLGTVDEGQRHAAGIAPELSLEWSFSGQSEQSPGALSGRWLRMPMSGVGDSGR